MESYIESVAMAPSPQPAPPVSQSLLIHGTSYIFNTSIAATNTFCALTELSKLASNTAKLSPTATRFRTDAIYATQHATLMEVNCAHDTTASPSVTLAVRSTRLASLIYIHIVLRSQPQTAASTLDVARRLKTVLMEVDSRTLYEQWNAPMSVLLWIVFMGVLACKSEREERRWFVELMVFLLPCVGIADGWRMGDYLGGEGNPWVEDVCDPFCGLLWLEIEKVQGGG